MSYLEDRVHFTCESGDIDERICSSVVSALSPQPLCLDSLAILSRHRFDKPLCRRESPKMPTAGPLQRIPICHPSL